ncbi:Poglut2 [Symbiodinium natans]|uniref:Poglut2 protein n=1 Tax=Symbiodinium natans TaxID=878477 RepID=A0A812KXH9_9DINO|nr:Poglut2 [Symbiodinium natans]
MAMVHLAVASRIALALLAVVAGQEVDPEDRGNGLCWYNSILAECDRSFHRCCVEADPDCWRGIWAIAELCCHRLTDQHQQCFDDIEERVESKLQSLSILLARAEAAGLQEMVEGLVQNSVAYQVMLAQPLAVWAWACSVPDSPLIWSRNCDCCEPAEDYCQDSSLRDEQQIWAEFTRCCFPVYSRKTFHPVDDLLQASISSDLEMLRPRRESIWTDGPHLTWDLGDGRYAKGCIISVHEDGTVSSCPESHACHDFDCSYLRAVLLALRVIQSINPLPALDFVLNAGDETVENTLPEAPVFTRTGTLWTATLALPFEWQLHPAQCQRRLKEGMLAVERLRWEDRKAVLIWRGTHSNLWVEDCRAALAAKAEEMMERCVSLPPGQVRQPVWNFSTWLQLPRGRLVWLSRFVPFIDAKFVEASVSSQMPRMEKSLEEFLWDEELIGSRIAGEVFGQYKYQIAMEGNSATDRLSWQLFMGSVVLIPGKAWQVMSPLNMLQPWVHFVPVSYDLSDLVDRLLWLMSHDAEAKAIAQNGMAFAHRRGHSASA